MKLSKNQLVDRLVDLFRNANAEDINSAVEQAKNQLGMLDKKKVPPIGTNDQFGMSLHCVLP